MKILMIAAYMSRAAREEYGDTRSSDLGGSRKIELLLAAMKGAGHDVLLLSSAMPGGARSGLRREKRETLDCGRGGAEVIYPPALHMSPFGGALNILRARSLASKVIAEYEPDVVWLYNSYVFEYMAASGRRWGAGFPSPALILEVEDLPLARRRGWLNLKPRLDALCWRPLLGIASGFCAVNSGIMAMLPAEKPRLLLPGMLDDRLVELAGGRTRPFSGRGRRLGYFGGLRAGKGGEVLIELIRRLPPEWSMVVSGGGSMAEDVRRLESERPGRVRFLGMVDSSLLYETLCSCDGAIVLPERVEAGEHSVFPFKIFEYLVADAHVIAPRLPAIEGVDLGYMRPWDGTVDSFLDLLGSAEADHAARHDERARARAEVLRRYTVKNAGSAITALLHAAGGGRSLESDRLACPDVMPGAGH
jgi:hypothetical protein